MEATTRQNKKLSLWRVLSTGLSCRKTQNAPVVCTKKVFIASFLLVLKKTVENNFNCLNSIEYNE